MDGLEGAIRVWYNYKYNPMPTSVCKATLRMRIPNNIRNRLQIAQLYHQCGARLNYFTAPVLLMLCLLPVLLQLSTSFHKLLMAILASESVCMTEIHFVCMTKIHFNTINHTNSFTVYRIPHIPWYVTDTDLNQSPCRLRRQPSEPPAQQQQLL